MNEESEKKFKFKTRQKKWLEQTYIDGWCNIAGRTKFYGHKKTSLGDARISKEVKKIQDLGYWVDWVNKFD